MQAARERAASLGFALSCEPGVGELLATLAAAVPVGGTIVELGTGAGVGLAWLVHGIGARRDLTLFTVDIDAPLQAATAAAGWPAYVRFIEGDGARVVRELAPIDLVFADAIGGKIEGLDGTIDALRAGGMLVVDDMELAGHAADGLADAIAHVRASLVAHPLLVSASLDFSSGVLLSTKRQAPEPTPANPVAADLQR